MLIAAIATYALWPYILVGIIVAMMLALTRG
jgi:hypothetical protein